MPPRRLCVRDDGHVVGVGQPDDGVTVTPGRTVTVLSTQGLLKQVCGQGGQEYCALAGVGLDYWHSDKGGADVL